MSAGERAYALRQEFERAFEELGLGAPESLFVELVTRYSEPVRAYHGVRHLEACFELFREVRDLAEHPAEVALALFFHDAVYDPRGHDNEAESAALAASRLAAAGVDHEVVERVCALVLATRHARVDADGGALSPDRALVVDVDLSILGADTDRYSRYEADVRHEYAWVPAELFRAGRSQLLRELLEREHIFATPALRQRFEAAARRNLAAALAALEARGA